MPIVLQTTLAVAAPTSGTDTTATVISKTVNIRGESCTKYPLPGRTVQAFIDAAEAAQKKGESVCLQPDLKLTVSGSLSVSAPAVLDFNGATITKSASMDGWLVSITSPGVSILDVTLRGNRSGGGQGGGLLCEASGCQVSDVHVTGMTTNGIEMRHPKSSLAISGSSVDGTVCAQPASGNGIMDNSGGVLHVTTTSAAGNSGNGFRLVNAGAGSSISGSSSSYNTEAGLSVLDTPNFTIGTFDSNADWHYGIVIWKSSNVQVKSVTVTETGEAEGELPLNGSGAAIELFGVSQSAFTSVHLSGMPGYGLALSRASKNTFYDVRVARDGKGETNPAVDLLYGSAHNTFQTVSVKDTSVGVDIGGNGVKHDLQSRLGNIDNRFVSLILLGNTYAAINIEGGSDNVFTLINATDVGSGYRPPDRAAIRLNYASTSYNKIDLYNTFINSSYLKWDTPRYLVYADSTANHNSVHLGIVQGGYTHAKWHDANGTNKFT